MSTSLRASKFRLAGGVLLALAGLLVTAFFLPDASQKRKQTEKAVKDATAAYDRQLSDLKAAQAEANRIEADRRSLDQLTSNMPAEGVGKLHWALSQKLYELTRKHNVRLLAIKYGAPGRESAKGTALEAIDVEFNVLGIYKDLKSFMLELESSKLPFAVVAAKLEEAPEGAHLTITLRAFRQVPGGAEPTSGEGA
jgi:hypothetical protein